MTKLIKLILFLLLLSIFTGCSTNKPKEPTKASKLDINKVCNQKLSINQLLTTAQTYNKIAQKHEVEFQLLGTSNSKIIEKINYALKADTKQIQIITQDDEIYTFSLKDASQKACIFSIRALQQYYNCKNSYHDDIPGDKFIY